MNDEIRTTVRMILASKKSNQSQLSRDSGVGRGHLSEMLRGNFGNATEAWQAVFKSLGVKLIIVPEDWPSEIEWSTFLKSGR